MIADAIGRPIAKLRESEASGRGSAVLALESLGLVRDPASLEPPIREVVNPDAARHARYRDARARQQTLYDKV